MVFMMAATWPDAIRSKPGYTDDGSEGGNRPDGATSVQNIGYSDHLHHKYWHFVDTPFSTDGTTLPALPNPNAETQIAAFRAVLASNDPDEKKSYDLVWLEHLVGDVHQPIPRAIAAAIWLGCVRLHARTSCTPFGTICWAQAPARQPPSVWAMRYPLPTRLWRQRRMRETGSRRASTLRSRVSIPRRSEMVTDRSRSRRRIGRKQRNLPASVWRLPV